ncbi:DUF4389 domain-containing protein [Pseudonocardia sp. CA-107938]|uniref:DUF4389 domain-containing protein n=1 Tax=Pseudonocardia sp. CA-107938 TaxID=3240021 RepID=UPI003D904507
MTSAVGSVRVGARLDTPLSRWLWLVKWVLVIPHAMVLVLLWAGFLVLSVVALVAILVTGHYPRRIFSYTLGVLRWTWRVAFYTTAAFGTDRYPPFSLGECPDYPATLDIAYPDHLSRGLVLVKWWLLALPHYIVLAFLLGGGYVASRSDAAAGAGLIGLLALFAVIALLFTGRYPRGLFDLVLGLDRWVLRVGAYVALMTDEYPPFRLDLGGAEPAALDIGAPPPAPDELGTGAQSATGSGPWTAGRVVSVVLGSVLVLSGLGALAGGAALLGADTFGGDTAGYVTSPDFRATGTGYALVAEPLRLGRATGAAPSDLLGEIRIRAAGTNPAGVFIGIGPAAAVDRALGGVAHDDLVVPGDRGRPAPRPTAGGAPSGVPAQLIGWTASVAGPGTQELRWTPVAGDWAVVVMNADGSRPVVADLSVGATAPGLRPLRVALLVAGGFALAVGAIVVAAALVAAGSGHARGREDRS